MIALTRRRLRGLRRLLRRHALGLPRSAPAPPVVLRGLGPAGGVAACWAGDGLALEAVATGLGGLDEAVALPLDGLAELEAPDDAMVTCDALASDRTRARWAERDVPREATYHVPALGTLPPFPESPASFEPAPADLLGALAEATRVATDDSTRYALDHLRLRGGPAGEVVATDGRQLIVHGGLPLPWDGELLVRRSPIFIAPEWLRGAPGLVGRTATHVVLRAGPWTLWRAIAGDDARFPRVDGVLPTEAAAATTIRLDPDDAAFLLARLTHLPGAAELNAPVTLDVDGRSVVVRAGGSGAASATELVLARSRATGDPARVATDRRFLARCLGLGGRTLLLAGAAGPVAGRCGAVTYGWQPLDRDAVLDPGAAALVLRSDLPAATPTTSPETPRRIMNDTPPPNGRGHAPIESAAPAADLPPPALAELIAEADALHAALGEARARCGRLKAALRRRRAHDRRVRETMRSIRRLGLADVAG